MRILYSQLINLPVQTQSDKFLGYVSDMEIDIDSYGILKIYVKSSNILRGLFEEHLIISQTQIIKITSEKIVVADNIKKKEKRKILNINLTENKNPIAVTADRK